MSLLIDADLVLGAIAMVGSLLLRRDAARRPIHDPDGAVVRSDLVDALRHWGTAALLVGLLALAEMPGGFTLPIWSALTLGAGATGALVFVVRWWLEGWPVAGSPARPMSLRIESETWPFALIGAVVALGTAYVLAMVIGIMQPVHLAISAIESLAGYAVGLVIWTPRTKIHRITTFVLAVPPAMGMQKKPLRRRYRRCSRPRRPASPAGGVGR